MTSHFRSLTGAALALTALAACQSPEAPDEQQAPAELTAAPAPAVTSGPLIILGQPHPWVGRRVRIRDYTGDSYDRCLGANALPAANVQLTAQLCYPSGLDQLQLFTVVGYVSGSGGFTTGRDAERVSLKSDYNPNYCVDVAWGTANGGELIQLYPCHWGANQIFHLPWPATSTATSATGTILTKNSNYTMAFEAGAPSSSGTVKPVWQKAYSGSAVYQRWTVELR